MSRLDDPRLVREEYASESGLRTRQAAYELAWMLYHVTDLDLNVAKKAR